MAKNPDDTSDTEMATAKITRSLGDLPPWRRRAIFARVRQAARVFEAPPLPRLTDVRNELQEARKRSEKDPALRVALSDEARLYVRAAMAELMNRTENRSDFTLEEIENGIALIQEDIISERANLGGRPPDERLRRFVTYLACIYHEENGNRPTHVVDPKNGLPVSPFNKFVTESLREFYPQNVDIPWSAAREAMRSVLLVDWDLGENVELADEILDAEQD